MRKLSLCEVICRARDGPGNRHFCRAGRWRLLDASTTEECMLILQYYIEAVELGPIDPQTRTGSYAMRLFREVM